MAEIYKQQLQHNTTGDSKLSHTPFKNYISEGLKSAAEGLNKLDEYFVYLDDKDLASKMTATAQEASNKIDEWKSFNTEGRTKLMSQIMDMYDETLSSANIDAQRRLNAANPEARKIFELKMKESILKKAKQQVIAEEKRSFDDIAVEISQIQDPAANKKAWQDALNNRVLQDPDDMIGVVERGEMTDDFNHNVVKRTILQALVDGNTKAAEEFLSDPLYVGRLGPDEYHGLQNSLKTLIKNQEEFIASGGNYKEFGNGLFMMRDWLQLKAKLSGDDPVVVDQGWQRFLTAISNGESIEDVYIKDRRMTDLITESEIQALRYLDSLPLSTIQLGINEYNKKMKEVFPNYKFAQDETGQQFIDYVNSLGIKDSDGAYDTRKINSEMKRKLTRLIGEIDNIEAGMDPSIVKEKNHIKMALERDNKRIDKTYSAQNWPLKQDRRGIWREVMNPAEYVGMGNITEAMISRAEKGEEVDFFETLFDYDTGAYDSDLSYDIAETVVPSMLESGEVDKKGKLVIPKSNSYNYMSYVIPVMFSGESVFGRQDVLEKVGIKKGVINERNTRLLQQATAQYYVDKGIKLEDPVDTYNSFWANKKVPEPGEYTTDSPDIGSSALFDMVMTVHGIAVDLGLAEEKAPDRSTMLSLAHVLRNVAAADNTLQSIGRTFDKEPHLPRDNSDYYKRINELTPRKVTNID